MENKNSEYIKGFNDAFVLAKYKPELIKNILGTKSQNEYLQGLKDGKDTFEQSKVKSRSLEIERLRIGKERNRGFER